MVLSYRERGTRTWSSGDSRKAKACPQEPIRPDVEILRDCHAESIQADLEPIPVGYELSKMLARNVIINLIK
jgi:hypothetical protein